MAEDCYSVTQGKGIGEAILQEAKASFFLGDSSMGSQPVCTIEANS